MRKERLPIRGLSVVLLLSSVRGFGSHQSMLNIRQWPHGSHLSIDTTVISVGLHDPDFVYLTGNPLVIVLFHSQFFSLSDSLPTMQTCKNRYFVMSTYHCLLVYRMNLAEGMC